tara:strand:+ start:652 stop:1623 length:972 start_codon:yes stop_codon:yes gene_type:complete
MARTKTKTKTSVFEKEYARALKKHRDEGQRVTMAMMESVAQDVARRMSQHAVKEQFEGISEQVGLFKDSVANSLRGVSQSMQDGKKLVLPPNCRYALATDQIALYVVEFAPQVRTVLVNRGDDYGYRRRRGGGRYRIALPYTVFTVFSARYNNGDGRRRGARARGKVADDQVWARGTNVACSFRNAPLQSLNDIVHPPFFPNLYRNNVMCLGQSGIDGKITPTEFVSESIRKFYASAFTGEAQYWNDGDAARPKAPSTKLKDWNTWEKNTAKNPLFPLKIKWKKGASLANLLQRLVPNHQVVDSDFNSEVNNALRRLTRNLTK